MSSLERAIALAAEKHAGQFDKAGQPYILHPLRVMLSVVGESARIAAVLHDVVEDSDVTLDDLRTMGFSEDAVGAVALLTRRDGDTYEQFIERVAVDSIAREVKLADLADNSDLSRLTTVTDKDRARLERYRRATEYLLAHPMALAAPESR